MQSQRAASNRNQYVSAALLSDRIRTDRIHTRYHYHIGRIFGRRIKIIDGVIALRGNIAKYINAGVTVQSVVTRAAVERAAARSGKERVVVRIAYDLKLLRTFTRRDRFDRTVIILGVECAFAVFIVHDDIFLGTVNRHSVGQTVAVKLIAVFIDHSDRSARIV